MDGATNSVNPGEIYDDPFNYDLLGDYINTTYVNHPVIWADIAIPRTVPQVIVGDIISDLKLSVPKGWEYAGMMVLSENSRTIEASFDMFPEPATLFLLGLGGLGLVRKRRGR